MKMQTIHHETESIRHRGRQTVGPCVGAYGRPLFAKVCDKARRRRVAGSRACNLHFHASLRVDFSSSHWDQPIRPIMALGEEYVVWSATAEGGCCAWSLSTLTVLAIHKEVEAGKRGEALDARAGVEARAVLESTLLRSTSARLLACVFILCAAACASAAAVSAFGSGLHCPRLVAGTRDKSSLTLVDLLAVRRCNQCTGAEAGSAAAGC